FFWREAAHLHLAAADPLFSVSLHFARQLCFTLAGRIVAADRDDRNFVPETTEQAAYAQAERLADDIPYRAVQASDCLHHDLAVAIPMRGGKHPLPDPFLGKVFGPTTGGR